MSDDISPTTEHTATRRTLGGRLTLTSDEADRIARRLLDDPAWAASIAAENGGVLIVPPEVAEALQRVQVTVDGGTAAGKD